MRQTASALAALLALAASGSAPARTLTYQAHEATWAQPALSPDGAWLWFDLLGDIYRMPAGGGTARPVLTGTAFERFPVPSPDGQWIAFLSDRSGVTNLWVSRPDGRDARPLTHETALVLMTSPAWAPDGRSVYVSRAVHAVLAFELWRVPLDGGAPTVLVKAQPTGTEGWDDRVNALGAAPSPMARRCGMPPSAATPGPKRPAHLVDRAPGSGQRRGGDGRAGRHAPGALARWYAARLCRTARWHHAGHQRDRPAPAQSQDRGRPLAGLADRSRWPGRRLLQRADPGYRFTPDGRALILARDGGFVRIDLASGTQTPLPFTAPVRLALAPQSRVRQRVEDGATVRTHLAEGAALSPDGRRIAFTALGTLYVADRDGGAPHTLFSGNAFQPAWSPDGQTIAFVRWSAEHGGSVWTIPATAGPPREWGKAGAYWSEPRWSRDGTTIMALRAAQFDRLHAENELDPAWPVDVVALSGPGAAPRVIAHGAGLRHLQQTDDGAWYVTSGGALARIEPDGTLRPRARRGAGGRAICQGTRPVDELRLSPDGRWLAARTAFELHLLPLPPGDQTVNLADPASGDRQITRIGADTMRWDGDGLSWTVGPFWHHADAATLVRPDPEAATPARDLSVQLPRALPAAPQVLRGATVLTMDHGAVVPMPMW
jgi:Tol biopolymer transport system component